MPWTGIPQNMGTMEKLIWWFDFKTVSAFIFYEMLSCWKALSVYLMLFGYPIFEAIFIRWWSVFKTIGQNRAMTETRASLLQILWIWFKTNPECNQGDYLKNSKSVQPAAGWEEKSGWKRSSAGRDRVEIRLKAILRETVWSENESLDRSPENGIGEESGFERNPWNGNC